MSEKKNEDVDMLDKSDFSNAIIEKYAKQPAEETQIWDEQIERDLKAGRLDSLLEEAKEDLESNRCDPL